MKLIIISFALLASIGASGQSKKKNSVDSTMRVVVTKVNNAEDFYQVQTKEVGTGVEFSWQCRCYSGSTPPPKEKDTLILVRPILPKKQPTRRFIFN